MILVFHDITELKQLEATRRDFVANVSHELRTPLTAIRGYAETLAGGAVTIPSWPPSSSASSNGTRNGSAGSSTICSTLSDLELGRTELQRTRACAGRPPFDAAVDVLHEKAARGQVEIHRELGPTCRRCDRRPRPCRAGAGQPDRQRRQVHAAGRTGDRGARVAGPHPARRARRRRQLGRDRRRRHRRRRAREATCRG